MAAEHLYAARCALAAHVAASDRPADDAEEVFVNLLIDLMHLAVADDVNFETAYNKAEAFFGDEDSRN